MAAAVEPGPVENTEPVVDEDDWLYGAKENEDSKPTEEGPGTPVVSENVSESQEDKEETKTSEAEKKASDSADSDSDSDSDDDDDIQINVRDSGPTPNQFRSGAAPRPSQPLNLPPKPTKGVDIDAQGMINGVATMEFDLQSLKNEDKPWRLPGSDITDYFNYGFNEETWIGYCHKQRMMRGETNAFSGRMGAPLGFAPLRKSTIDVIGASEETSRRPLENEMFHPMGGVIKVLGQDTYNHHSNYAAIRPLHPMPPPGLPPPGMPPPGFPGMHHGFMPPPPFGPAGHPPPDQFVPGNQFFQPHDKIFLKFLPKGPDMNNPQRMMDIGGGGGGGGGGIGGFPPGNWGQERSLSKERQERERREGGRRDFRERVEHHRERSRSRDRRHRSRSRSRSRERHRRERDSRKHRESRDGEKSEDRSRHRDDDKHKKKKRRDRSPEGGEKSADRSATSTVGAASSSSSADKDASQES